MTLTERLPATWAALADGKPDWSLARALALEPGRERGDRTTRPPGMAPPDHPGPQSPPSPPDDDPPPF